VENLTILQDHDLAQLLTALHGHGYTILGPTLGNGAIVYDEVHSMADLPVGYTDAQAPGTYQLTQGDSRSIFGYTIGANSWKQFLHPARAVLWEASQTDDQVTIQATDPPNAKYALFGVRACELKAIAIQDRVLYRGDYADPIYARARAPLFIIAVNCTHAGNTCFCLSMGSGPEATTGFDLSMTEIESQTEHYFVVRVGTERGQAILDEIAHRSATQAEADLAARRVANATQQMGRILETDGLQDLLYRNLEHPVWQELENQCLSCGNCTLVCPTCFCTTTNEVTDLTVRHTQHVRTWDSCFTTDFSYIHGGSVRASTRSRYRQWMTHKLATWIDQFDTEGCVGCGRCITWCPVGIDLTEVARQIRDTDGAHLQKS